MSIRGKLALPRHVPLVVATRGDAVESVHYGSIAVVSAAGAVLYAAGDMAFPAFTRSTLKPFQALPFVAEGGPAHFGFSARQVALMCASHSGEPHQIEAVADMLARIGCGVDDLQCSHHPPLFHAATGTPPPDFAPTPLHHNCSGKHAGFLAWCRLHRAPCASYLDPAHPLQQAIRRELAHLLGCGEDELAIGTDGCSAPNHALPLARLAYLYARLATHRQDAPQAAALGELFDAMSMHPEMVAGEARADLILMRAGAGDWVAKGGAEGVQALGIRSRGWGIALKVADGSVRALKLALAALMEQLGLRPADGGALQAWRQDEIRNAAGRRTGAYLPVFRLVSRRPREARLLGPGVSPH